MAHPGPIKHKQAETSEEAAKKPRLSPPFQEASLDSGVSLLESSVDPNRFESFAPVRQGQVKWLIDGKDYMSAIADAIAAARYEIFITDWQIHPYVHLKRPDTGVTNLDWRLDKLLLKKANENVQIYILLYWETKLAMDLGSSFALSVLSHDNITILRHPDWSTVLTHTTTLLRWSHHEKLVVVDRSIAFVGGIDLCFGRWDTNDHPLTDDYPHCPCVLEEGDPVDSEEPGMQFCRWVGKDYGNTFLAGARDKLDKPLEDIIDKESSHPIRSKIPRMPWHDVSCMFVGEAVMDVARHFIQRYNQICKTMLEVKKQFNVPVHETLSDQNWDHPINGFNIENPSTSEANIQVVRSVASWSAGQRHEDSIHKAYHHAIRNAQHSIYIENQFFISSQDGTVENRIQADLAERLARAYSTKQNFYVMILLPLQPEFPGEWGTSSGKDLEAVSYWNYASLYNGEHSLQERLKALNVSNEYQEECIKVYGLRTHGILNEELVTELIYVHSKLMIVDDRITIIGSANINDRSMCGNRDSEVAVVIEDKEMIPGTMNGRPDKVGKFSHLLRCQLIKEHLGILKENGRYDIDVEDPTSQQFFDQVSQIAEQNSKTYLDIFKGKIIPNNQIINQEDLEKWKTVATVVKSNDEVARKELEQIHGHIVSFPRNFLKAYLQPSHLDMFQLYVANTRKPTQIPLNQYGGDNSRIC